MSPSVNIIIVNFNTRDLLHECLVRLFDFYIVVVDNASSDGSVEMLREKFPSVKLIANRKNRGFGAACNQGIAATDSEFVLILNPDTQLEPSALHALLEVMQANPNVGLCAPRIVNPDGSLQFSCRRFPALHRLALDELGLSKQFPNSRFFGAYRMTWWNHADLREVEQPMGAALLLRKKALDDVGYFDERFFMYFEEVDLCFRLHQKGWKILFVPHAQVVHHGGQSAKQHLVEMTLARYRSMCAFYRKHYPRWHLVFLKFIILVAAFARLLAYSVPPYTNASKRRAFAQVLREIGSI